jgi:hypothetical protein
VTVGPTAAKAVARAEAENRKAIDQAKLAYEFVPGSYTYGALSACLAAEQALAVLRASLERMEQGHPQVS